VANGLYYGVTGLCTEPMQGIKRYGTTSGLLVGLMKGIVGLVGKPIIGVLDATTHIGDSVRDSVRKVFFENASYVYIVLTGDPI
jgi:hypothetical protein